MTSGDAGTWTPSAGLAHPGPGRPASLSEACARRHILQDFQSPRQARFRRKPDSRFRARARGSGAGRGINREERKEREVPAGPRRPGSGAQGLWTEVARVWFSCGSFAPLPRAPLAQRLS